MQQELITNSEEETAFFNSEVENQVSSTVIDLDQNQIELIVSCGTNLETITPTFSIPEKANAMVNGTIQQSGVSTLNFKFPVTYLVENPNMCAQKEWIIIIREEQVESTLENTPSFTNFTIENQVGSTLIDLVNHKILLSVICQQDISSLTPTFSTMPGSIVTIKKTDPISTENTVDFTSPITYIIKDSENCVLQEWVVEVDNSSVDLSELIYFVPNVFTPNNDGFNDNFVIGEGLQKSTLTIYNRYGSNVFKSENYTNQFNGNNLESGTYYYSLKNACLDTPLSGTVNILR